MKVWFPHEKVRAEQNEFVKDAAEAITKGKIFLAHAPTGLGKTVSSLAPALSYALENNKKVFFLTPKISQHEIVLATARMMNEKFNLGIKAIDLVGRKQMCVDPFTSRTGMGFYEACAKRKKDKTCKYFTNAKGYTPKQKAVSMRLKRGVLQEYNNSYLHIKEQCQHRELCPYEITLEMIKGAHLIIGDYSHLFHEDISEGILGAAQTQLEDIVLIVDEAHNLPERLRDMLETSFDVSALEKAIKEAKNVGDFEVEFLLKDIEKEMLALGKKLSLDKSEARIEAHELDFLRKIARDGIMQMEETAEKFMTKNKTENSYLMALCSFLITLLHEKQHTLYLVQRKGSLGIGVYPMDPSELASEVLSKVHSAILMSGTLLPLQMYSDVLGITESGERKTEKEKTQLLHNQNVKEQFASAKELSQTKKETANPRLLRKEYKSPFPKENRINLFVGGVTTKYTSRSTGQYTQIAEIIDRAVAKVPGNTIVFFPSFDVMQSVKGAMKTRRQILKQEPEMSQDEKTKLIHNFKLLGSRFGGVLLAVSGGSIAEGIDFPGDYLSCAIIIGVPFGKMDITTQALIDFYEKEFHKGWEYAYNGPAITKAMQAAGRVIRTETDRGVIVFVDERFGEERFRQYYPKDFEMKKTNEPEKEIDKFFG
ncbi:ATP-dependent DNA helicase [uncultured archaeon]|nr:ATP-dependent DNA helicase [uncultured archaeon]